MARRTGTKSTSTDTTPETVTPVASRPMIDILKDDVMAKIDGGEIVTHADLELYAAGNDDIGSTAWDILEPFAMGYIGAKIDNDATNGTTDNESETVMTDTTTETIPVNDETPDNGDAPTNDTTPTTEDPNAPAFVLPANPEDLDLGEDMANFTGRNILKWIGEVAAIDKKLKSKDEANSPAAITAFAVSDDASENVKALFAAHAAAEQAAKDALSALTESVKAEIGNTILSEADVEKLDTKRKKTVALLKVTQGVMEDMAEDNDMPEITAFLSVVPIPGARRQSSKSGTTASGSYNTTTSIRPRVTPKGHAPGIIVDGVAYEAFSDVTKALKKSKTLDFTVGDMHNGWAKAGGFDLTKWSVNAPRVTEFILTGSEDGAKAHTVRINFTPENSETYKPMADVILPTE